MGDKFDAGLIDEPKRKADFAEDFHVVVKSDDGECPGAVFVALTTARKRENCAKAERC